MNKIVKIILSIAVAICAVYPYVFPSQKSGSIETVAELGLMGSIVLGVLFFAAIAFYCRDLEKCLSRIQPQNRTASPKSVWYMFLIPYNIIEDFFIIITISSSIQNERKVNSNLYSIKDDGLVIGIGWCTAQVLSLIPSVGGQISGLIALVLWVIHWGFIRRVNQHLLLRKGN
jgi:hypothetical protein